MTAVIYPPVDQTPAVPAGVPRLQRARGLARVVFKRDETGRTRLADLYQEGSCKVRLPRNHDPRGPEAVLLNTAGGITGGDSLVYEASWGAGASATVTGQAAERIYRRADGVGSVENRLVVGPGASARWLPQETIVFDRSGFRRRMEVDMAGSARLVAVEAVVLGRTAMGEEVHTLSFTDRWRIRRDGRLVFADALRLMGDTRAILAGGATGGGARAMASIVLLAPDAEARLEPLRVVADAPDAPGEAAASAFDGVVVVRLLAPDGRALRRRLGPILEFIIEGPLPRVWSI